MYRAPDAPPRLPVTSVRVGPHHPPAAMVLITLAMSVMMSFQLITFVTAVMTRVVECVQSASVRECRVVDAFSGRTSGVLVPTQLVEPARVVQRGGGKSARTCIVLNGADLVCSVRDMEEIVAGINRWQRGGASAPFRQETGGSRSTAVFSAIFLLGMSYAIFFPIRRRLLLGLHWARVVVDPNAHSITVHRRWLFSARTNEELPITAETKVRIDAAPIDTAWQNKPVRDGYRLALQCEGRDVLPVRAFAHGAHRTKLESTAKAITRAIAQG